MCECNPSRCSRGIEAAYGRVHVQRNTLSATAAEGILGWGSRDIAAPLLLGAFTKCCMKILLPCGMPAHALLMCWAEMHGSGKNGIFKRNSSNILSTASTHLRQSCAPARLGHNHECKPFPKHAAYVYLHSDQ